MVKFKKLEELRTRREVEEYFKQLGKNITDEELTALKQNYDKAQETNGALTMQQLDDVAGGENCHLVTMENGKPNVETYSNQRFIGFKKNALSFFVNENVNVKTFNDAFDNSELFIHHDQVRLFGLIQTDEKGCNFSFNLTGEPWNGEETNMVFFKGINEHSNFIVVAKEMRRERSYTSVNQGYVFIFHEDEAANKALPYIQYLVSEAHRHTYGEGYGVEFEFSDLKSLFDDFEFSDLKPLFDE